jgi:hypothetical protein
LYTGGGVGASETLGCGLGSPVVGRGLFVVIQFVVRDATARARARGKGGVARVRVARSRWLVPLVCALCEWVDEAARM